MQQHSLSIISSIMTVRKEKLRYTKYIDKHEIGTISYTKYEDKHKITQKCYNILCIILSTMNLISANASLF